MIQLSKTLLLTAIFAFSFLVTMGQGSDKTELRFRAGVVLGVNATQVDGDDLAGYHKLGLNGGFIAHIPVSKKFFFSTEILYTQKGSKSRTYAGYPLAYKLKLNYAEIPVLINFQEKTALNFGIGVSYGRVVKVREFIEGLENIPTTFDVSTTDVNELNRSDYNVIANANYLFTKNFFLNVRFAYSFVPVGRFLSSNFNNRALYNNLLSFRLGYVF
jgi:hypothetical protein